VKRRLTSQAENIIRVQDHQKDPRRVIHYGKGGGEEPSAKGGALPAGCATTRIDLMSSLSEKKKGDNQPFHTLSGKRLKDCGGKEERNSFLGWKGRVGLFSIRVGEGSLLPNYGASHEEGNRRWSKKRGAEEKQQRS